MEKNNQDIKEILKEKNFIKTIIDKGTKFTINYSVKVRQKGFKGLFLPKVTEERTEEFVLKEPTLAVLDRASEVWLRMNTEDIEKEGSDVIKEGYKLANKYAKDMAECLAILVLGEAYYSVDGGDDKELGRLSDLFYKTVKPSQAEEIAMFINATSNLVDFVNSMRLMKMSKTTTPTARVE